jgi:signal transduction histidine kinase
LRQAIKEVRDIMNLQIQQKGLQLKLKVSKNLPDNIYSDAKRLKQILYNLVGNAVKFTYKGSITIQI